MKQILKNVLQHFVIEKTPLTAYEMWADIYEKETDNLMLYFDRILFEQFISNVNLRNKIILDFGCGTGRYWNDLLMRVPAKIIGCDISGSMINKLKLKFPDAETHILRNNYLKFLDDNSVDFIISTLVIAHIKDVEEVFKEWDRALSKDGVIFITDFHPAALERGAKRTFNKNGKTITIKNYIHTLEKLDRIFSSLGFELKGVNERIIDESVKEFYLEKDAIKIYEKFKNVPMIYSMQFQK
jgi:ubiquinone/menaquinone biosynthesis C-methylase UbiE